MTTARDIMHVGAECIGEHETVARVARQMRDLDVGALPIRHRPEQAAHPGRPGRGARTGTRTGRVHRGRAGRQGVRDDRECRLHDPAGRIRPAQAPRQEPHHQAGQPASGGSQKTAEGRYAGCYRSMATPTAQVLRSPAADFSSRRCARPGQRPQARGLRRPSGHEAVTGQGNLPGATQGPAAVSPLPLADRLRAGCDGWTGRPSHWPPRSG